MPGGTTFPTAIDVGPSSCRSHPAATSAITPPQRSDKPSLPVSQWSTYTQINVGQDLPSSEQSRKSSAPQSTSAKKQQSKSGEAGTSMDHIVSEQRRRLLEEGAIDRLIYVVKGLDPEKTKAAKVQESVDWLIQLKEGNEELEQRIALALYNQTERVTPTNH